jgi:hypothetical protein
MGKLALGVKVLHAGDQSGHHVLDAVTPALPKNKGTQISAQQQVDGWFPVGGRVAHLGEGQREGKRKGSWQRRGRLDRGHRTGPYGLGENRKSEQRRCIAETVRTEANSAIVLSAHVGHQRGRVYQLQIFQGAGVPQVHLAEVELLGNRSPERLAYASSCRIRSPGCGSGNGGEDLQKATTGGLCQRVIVDKYYRRIQPAVDFALLLCRLLRWGNRG